MRLNVSATVSIVSVTPSGKPTGTVTKSTGVSSQSKVPRVHTGDASVGTKNKDVELTNMAVTSGHSSTGRYTEHSTFR